MSRESALFEVSLEKQSRYRRRAGNRALKLWIRWNGNEAKK
jgi:hypothetical protein